MHTNITTDTCVPGAHAWLLEAHALRSACSWPAGHVSDRAFDVTARAFAIMWGTVALLAEFIKLLESLVETELISAFPVSASLAEARDLGQPEVMSLVEGL